MFLIWNKNYFKLMHMPFIGTMQISLLFTFVHVQVNEIKKIKTRGINGYFSNKAKDFSSG